MALVKPGVPGLSSTRVQRKTPVIVAVRDGDRLVGLAGAPLLVRHPSSVYTHFALALGQTAPAAQTDVLSRRAPYVRVERAPDRDAVVFRHDENTTFTAEELVAMMLAEAARQASATAREPIRDVVITVPPYYNQAERQAMLSAAQLAGLKVLRLIDSTAATALHYGVFRRSTFNDTAQYIMFYDMGAGSTTASTVAFSTETKEGKAKSGAKQPHAEILSVGYDRTLGGLEIELRLRDYVARAQAYPKIERHQAVAAPCKLAPRPSARLVLGEQDAPVSGSRSSTTSTSRSR